MASELKEGAVLPLYEGNVHSGYIARADRYDSAEQVAREVEQQTDIPAEEVLAEHRVKHGYYRWVPWHEDPNSGMMMLQQAKKGSPGAFEAWYLEH